MYVPVSTSRFPALLKALLALSVLGLILAAGAARSAPEPTPGVAPLTAPSSTAEAQAGDEVVDAAEQRILVRFEPGVAPAERAEARDSIDAEFLRGYSLVPRLQLIELPEGVNREEAIEALESEPGVAYAEPDTVRTLEVTNPNDTFYKSPYFFLWGLNNTGQSFTVGSTSFTGTPDADIDAPEAWDLSRGSSSVTVAVIDSGMQLNHPDLTANLWNNPDEIAGNGIDDDGNGRVDDVNGWDFVNGDNDPTDDDGHGTHVAGTVGAVGNNGIGVTGVAWNVKLMPLKACNAAGSCAISSTIAALNYAVAEGVKISNNSYGGIGGQNTAERNAITAARDAGHLYVAAAGNDGLNTDLAGNAHYPSNYNLDNIISVASTTLNDGISSFSNYGTTSVDLGAPGSQILSTYPGSSYVWADGTSMASPHVAGAAALVKARKPGWTYSQIRSRLIGSTTTRPLTALSGKTVSGGMLNAYDALSFAPDPPTIESGPSGFVSSTSASLAFTGETVGAGTTFECRIDSGSWESCTSPKSYASLSQGSHTFEVRQTDQAGNVSTAASQTWTADTIAPSAPAISSGPSGLVSSTSASFAFTGEASATFECRLDEATWTTCSSPKTFSSLDEGPHSFEVRQTDRAGNLSPVGTQTWDVILTVARPEITSGPEGSVNSTSATFQFTGVVGATFKCRIDDGSLFPCTSPFELTGLTAGPHEFAVQQTDLLGNTSLETVRTWTVLEVATVQPTLSGTDPTGAIVFEGAPEGFTYLCAIGPEQLHPCSNPYAPVGLTDGTYPLTVVVEDPEGNLSAPLKTDLVIEGAPAPSGSQPTIVLNGGATYTQKAMVTLAMVWPTGARTALVTNSSDFPNPAVSVTGSAPWDLTPGQGSKKVTVQFLGAGDTPLSTVSDTIFLDPNRPNLKSAKIRKQKGRVWWTAVKAGDSGSRLSKLALSTRRSRPGADTKPTKQVKFVKSTTVKTKLPSRPRWAKVQDRAGNWSDWKAVKAP